MAGPSDAESHSIFQRFVHSEVGGSVVLLVCSLTALVWANSPWADRYFEILHTYIGISWGDASFKLSLQHWVNDGLMVLFFFVVGLEIKREISVGELSSLGQAALPVAAAIGGMVVPALAYLALNLGGEGAVGWGIPMATDIAFALGVLALFGSRAPLGLKVFLTALAIADDIGAVLVIAIFYTEQISVPALLLAAGLLALLAMVLRMNVPRALLFVPLGLGVWIAVLASGVHATVAGILMALVVPVRARIEPAEFMARARRSIDELDAREVTRESMIFERGQLDALEQIHRSVNKMRPAGLILEQALHPVQAFWVLPLFALFNAGVAVDGKLSEGLQNPISLGVIAGLVLGKPIGVVLVSWLAVRSGRASLPESMTWSHILGAGWLAGIGFTMSLFVSDLAFTEGTLVADAKLGILTASLVAGVCGFVVLHRSLPRQPRKGS